MTTPEGYIKAAVNKVIAKFKAVYKFMPVPYGFGMSSLDYLLCVEGRFVAIETKAPGKKPTPRQKMIISQIERAGGKVFVIDSTEGAKELELYLEKLTHDARSGEYKVQGGCGSGEG